jgi:hypothetical protein
VEGEAVVKSVLHQCLDALNVLWCEIWPELNNDTAIFQVQIERVFGAGGSDGDYGEYRCENRREKAGTQHGVPLLLIVFADFQRVTLYRGGNAAAMKA